MVDFVRAEAPKLPFKNRSLSAVLQASALHFHRGPQRASFQEIRRIRSAPGARYIASTYVAASLPLRLLQSKARLYIRGEDELRGSLTSPPDW